MYMDGFRWFSQLGYCGSCCNELGSGDPPAILPSVVLDVYPQGGQLGHMVVVLFNFLRNLLAVSHSNCTDLHPHQKGIGLSLFTSSPALVTFFIHMTAIPAGVR